MVELLRVWHELRRRRARRQERHLLQLAASIEQGPRRAGNRFPCKTSEGSGLKSKPRRTHLLSRAARLARCTSGNPRSTPASFCGQSNSNLVDKYPRPSHLLQALRDSDVMGQALNANLLRSSRTRTRKVHQACYKNVSPHAHAHFGYCKTRMFLRARTASPRGPKHNTNTEGASGFPHEVQAQQEHGTLASTATETLATCPCPCLFLQPAHCGRMSG